MCVHTRHVHAPSSFPFHSIWDSIWVSIWVGAMPLAFQSWRILLRPGVPMLSTPGPRSSHTLPDETQSDCSCRPSALRRRPQDKRYSCCTELDRAGLLGAPRRAAGMGCALATRTLFLRRAIELRAVRQPHQRRPLVVTTLVLPANWGSMDSARAGLPHWPAAPLLFSSADSGCSACDGFTCSPGWLHDSSGMSHGVMGCRDNLGVACRQGGRDGLASTRHAPCPWQTLVSLLATIALFFRQLEIKGI